MSMRAREMRNSMEKEEGNERKGNGSRMSRGLASRRNTEWGRPSILLGGGRTYDKEEASGVWQKRIAWVRHYINQLRWRYDFLR